MPLAAKEPIRAKTKAAGGISNAGGGFRDTARRSADSSDAPRTTASFRFFLMGPTLQTAAGMLAPTRQQLKRLVAQFTTVETFLPGSCGIGEERSPEASAERMLAAKHCDAVHMHSPMTIAPMRISIMLSDSS
jgi:hypothetical protein